MAVPNFPTQRAWNLLFDEPRLLNRWRKYNFENVDVDNCLLLPDYAPLRPKAEDPDWRKNWPWILLRSTGPVDCYPAFSCPNGNEASRRLCLPINTSHFAMRIGPYPINVVTIDFDGNFHQPYTTQIMGKSRVISSAKGIKSIAYLHNLKITFI